MVLVTMEQCLSKERVWFDQQRYEQAEGSYQRVLAERHAGLCVQVSAPTFAASHHIDII